MVALFILDNGEETGFLEKIKTADAGRNIRPTPRSITKECEDTNAEPRNGPLSAHQPERTIPSHRLICRKRELSEAKDLWSVRHPAIVRVPSHVKHLFETFVVER